MDKYSYREPKTTVEFTPTLNSVLLKLTYKLTITGITSKVLPDNLKISLTVAGYGENTYGFNIGDVVYMNNDFRKIEPFLIMLPGNKYSKSEANKMLDGLTKEQIMEYNKEGKQFIIYDYIVVPSYGILGYLPKDSEQAKFISKFKKREPISNSTAKEYFDLN